MKNIHQFPGTELCVMIPGICTVIGTLSMIFAG